MRQGPHRWPDWRHLLRSIGWAGMRRMQVKALNHEKAFELSVQSSNSCVDQERITRFAATAAWRFLCICRGRTANSFGFALSRRYKTFASVLSMIAGRQRDVSSLRHDGEARVFAAGLLLSVDQLGEAVRRGTLTAGIVVPSICRDLRGNVRRWQFLLNP